QQRRLRHRGEHAGGRGEDQAERTGHGRAERVEQPRELDERQRRHDGGDDREPGRGGEPGRAGGNRQQRSATEDADHRTVATRVGLRPPYRRSRFWYSSTAWSRWLARKSGHSVSVTQISAYAICQSRKLLTRSSPLVRMSRSGSGCPAV